MIRKNGETDNVYDFNSKHDALEWIKEKSQSWLAEAAS
jgi:hypothetical protein